MGRHGVWQRQLVFQSGRAAAKARFLVMVLPDFYDKQYDDAFSIGPERLVAPGPYHCFAPGARCCGRWGAVAHGKLVHAFEPGIPVRRPGFWYCCWRPPGAPASCVDGAHYLDAAYGFEGGLMSEDF